MQQLGKSIPSSPRISQRSRKCAALLVLCLSTASNLAQADPLLPEAGYNYGEVETPRITAVGGALRATSNSTSALFVNPANMAATPLYHLGAFAQIYPEAGRQSYGAAIVDSIISSTGISGGLGGVWNQQDPDGMNRQSTDIRFGLALPLGDILLLGVSGRAFSLSQRGEGPLGPSYASGGLGNESIVNTFTFDAGATLRPVPGLSLAVTGHNLTNPGHALLPLMGGVGIGYSSQIFSVGADVVFESRTYQEMRLRAMGGLELLLADVLAVRGGYRYDQGLDTHAVSGGLGYVDRLFSIDAAVRRSVSGVEYTSVVFGFAIHIEAMGLGAESVSEY